MALPRSCLRCVLTCWIQRCAIAPGAVDCVAHETFLCQLGLFCGILRYGSHSLLSRTKWIMRSCHCPQPAACGRNVAAAGCFASMSSILSWKLWHRVLPRSRLASGRFFCVQGGGRISHNQPWNQPPEATCRKTVSCNTVATGFGKAS